MSAAMSAHELAHLAAMGLPPPSVPTATEPAPETPVTRANALVIPVMESSKANNYLTERVKDGFRSMRAKDRKSTKDEGFATQRLRHKRIQAMQYAYHPWMDRRLPKIPLVAVSKLAGMADVAAHLAVAQAEAHAYLLRIGPRPRLEAEAKAKAKAKSKDVDEPARAWEYGYYTFKERRKHEGYAESNRLDAFEWSRVSATLRARLKAEETRIRRRYLRQCL
ncbi:hypothetical protein CH63R_14326 [Colletotrichum higginsianum IMI 349063]|uniref:Uncharacterized protein n=1 Tax=Colletotrichum higginsianum (strain IMI 349063) TaxID=759273 RepID=A0A1B7XTM1_COLHI|nr:hypothetical protein CH63R_14326 [Colletotrichum higginsianum IMI 349063]OBR03100.1 hypothetical protein CH63R_14326 [Colletotrichum higginsianum IMI 349063]